VSGFPEIFEVLLLSQMHVGTTFLVETIQCWNFEVIFAHV